MAKKPTSSLQKGQQGEHQQVFPMIPGNAKSTSGAASIDVSGYSLIWIDTACTIYLDSYSSDTIKVAAGDIKGCEKCTTIHVDKAINYMVA